MSDATPITFTCPNPDCGKDLRVAAAAAGLRVRCPRCKQLTTAPLSLDDAEPAPAPLSLDDDAPRRAAPVRGPREWQNGLDGATLAVLGGGLFLLAVVALSTLMPWVCYRNAIVIYADTGARYHKCHSGMMFTAGIVVLCVDLLVLLAVTAATAWTFVKPNPWLPRGAAFAGIAWAMVAAVVTFSQRFVVLNADSDTAEILPRPTFLEPYAGTGLTLGPLAAFLACVAFLVFVLRVESNLARTAKRGATGPNSAR